MELKIPDTFSGMETTLVLLDLERNSLINVSRAYDMAAFTAQDLMGRENMMGELDKQPLFHVSTAIKNGRVGISNCICVQFSHQIFPALDSQSL